MVEGVVDAAADASSSFPFPALVLMSQLLGLLADSLWNNFCREIAPNSALLLTAELGQCGSYGKEAACNAGHLDSTPGSGRSPEEGNGNLLQYSCLENSMDRGAWRVTVHGVAKSST